jgi:hypothetical protein
MIELGKSLESNIFKGLEIKAALVRAESQLGPQVCIGSQTKYLPAINDAESYLFALNYYLHLTRFQQVHSSSRLVQHGNFMEPGIEALKPEYLALAEHLKSMLLNFEKDFVHLLTRHKRLSTMSGNNFFENGLSLIQSPDIATQIAKVLHLKCKLAANYFDTLNNQELNVLVASLNQVMSDTRRDLQEIANLRLLMEQNELENKAVLDYVRHPQEEKNKKRALETIENEDFPIDALEDWAIVVNSLKKRNPATKAAVKLVRGAGHLTEATLNAFSYNQESTNPVGLDNEQGNASLSEEEGDDKTTPLQASNLRKKAPSLVDANCPKPQTKLLSDRCINQCNIKIAEKVLQWRHQFPNIDKELIVNSKASELKLLSDKVLLLQHMMNAQYALERFKEKHNHGIVRFSNWGVIGLLSKWLSKSFFRPLMNDTLLLMYAADEINQQLTDAINNVNRISGSQQDLTDRTNECHRLIYSSKLNAHDIKERSLYCFFKPEINQAHLDFNQTLEAIGPAPEGFSVFTDETGSLLDSSPKENPFRVRELGDDSDEDEEDDAFSPCFQSPY